MTRTTLILAIAVAMMLVACAGPAPRAASGMPGSTTVPLRNGKGNAGGVRYDKASGTCSAGAVQLMSPERFDELRSGWSLPDGCTGVAKKRIPDETGYPDRFAKLGMPGSAQVLVRVQVDGSVESAHATCATDSAFAEVAESTARAIAFTPASCDGKPVPSAVLVPFDYAWN